MLLIFCSHRLWQLADYKLIRLFYPLRYSFCGKLPIIHVAPMLLVPMKRWGHRRISLAQRLVSLRSQFTCKPRILALHAKPTSTQPKAQKNLALNTKGDNVFAKRLILSHTKQRQSVFPDLLNVHKALFFSFFRRDTWRLFLIFRRRSIAIFALRTVLAKEYYHHNLIYRNYATEKYILAKYHKRSNVSSKSSIVIKLRTSETHIETIMIVATTGKNIHHPLRPVSCNRLIDIGMVTSQNGGRKFDMK